MRTLLLFRGSPASGKSTYIEKCGLLPYTLSADSIRTLCQSPVLNVQGSEEISQSNEKVVWEMLFRLLETRMIHGEFTVVDATNSKTSEINKYKKLCDKYRYRLYCIDLTDVPIEVAKERNRNRQAFKRVPEFVIDRMYSRFATQTIPSGVTVLKPNELNKAFIYPIDLSKYKKIHCFGDIHGCNTVLQQYFTENGGLKEDECYIFCGDYLDRGIENADTFKFFYGIMEKNNVMLLEGNHERHLSDWGHNEKIHSKEFVYRTLPQLIQAGITQKDARIFYRHVIQCGYFTYDNKTFIVTHGGISNIPANLSFLSTEQMIKGVGDYGDVANVDKTFNELTNYYSIHGHRNITNAPIQTGRTFNLEGDIEFGGHLRVVQITPNHFSTFEFHNEVFRPLEKKVTAVVTENSDNDAIIEALRSNKYVTEKQFGNISSFNFSSKAFLNNIWNEQTIKARGLYINNENNTVVARSYSKFFRINEREETKIESLKRNLQFPVNGYLKENGYLGIVSYNPFTEDLFITTKSNPEGTFAEWLREKIDGVLTQDQRTQLIEFTKQYNVSFVFENIDMQKDPHIIDYTENHLVLLDIVYNDFEFKKVDYEDMCKIAERFGFEHKKLAFVFDNWESLYDWYNEVKTEDYQYQNKYVEGFVLEDAQGFMTKVKTGYYNFWKYMRSVAHSTLRHGNIAKTSGLVTPLANAFYGWVKNILYILPLEEKEKLPSDICSLRKMFFEYQNQNKRI